LSEPRMMRARYQTLIIGLTGVRMAAANRRLDLIAGGAYKDVPVPGEMGRTLAELMREIEVIAQAAIDVAAYEARVDYPDITMPEIAELE
jgi:hypothetical protein